MREPFVFTGCHGCSSRSVLADQVLVASMAATGVAMSMTAKEARWLLCEFPPASARLYAEFRRLRESCGSGHGCSAKGIFTTHAQTHISSFAQGQSCHGRRRWIPLRC